MSANGAGSTHHFCAEGASPRLVSPGGGGVRKPAYTSGVESSLRNEQRTTSHTFPTHQISVL